MRKTFKYRIYPTKAQEAILDRWLYLCRQLYNAMLEQRQIAWKMGHKVGWVAQANELPELKRVFPEYLQIGSHVLQDVARRLDKSFQRFFKGAGYPRYQGKNRYDSFTFACSSGWKIVGKRLRISNCGFVKVRWSREIEGTIKNITIKRKAGQWFVCFCCDDVPVVEYPPASVGVGIDLGIESLATTSDGERFANGRYHKRMQKRIRRLQRHHSRQKKGSNRRDKSFLQIQRLYRKTANQRRDANHKVSTTLVERYGTIVHEDVSPQFMLKNPRLSKAVSDVGWSQFLTFLQSKAAAAGRTVIKVDPRYTSQMCSGCGQIVKKKLSQRWHSCDCGTSLHRDHNAAINILHAAGL